MRYSALATDDDGILASHDTVSTPVQHALKRLPTSGRTAISARGTRLFAQKLAVFCQTGQGISEKTWLFLLHRGDYPRGLRHAITDDFLAGEAQHVEWRSDLTPWKTRAVIRGRVNARYI